MLTTTAQKALEIAIYPVTVTDTVYPSKGACRSLRMALNKAPYVARIVTAQNGGSEVSGEAPECSNSRFRQEMTTEKYQPKGINLLCTHPLLCTKCTREKAWPCLGKLLH